MNVSMYVCIIVYLWLYIYSILCIIMYVYLKWHQKLIRYSSSLPPEWWLKLYSNKNMLELIMILINSEKHQQCTTVHRSAPQCITTITIFQEEKTGTHPLMSNALSRRFWRTSCDVIWGSTQNFLYSGCIIPSHFCNDKNPMMEGNQINGASDHAFLLSPVVWCFHQDSQLCQNPRIGFLQREFSRNAPLKTVLILSIAETDCILLKFTWCVTISDLALRRPNMRAPNKTISGRWSALWWRHQILRGLDPHAPLDPPVPKSDYR